MLQIVKNAQKLRSLLFPSVGLKSFSNQVLDNLFRTLKYLRSLDLSSSVILVLPGSIEELKLLRYLDLSRTKIKVLRLNLQSLQFANIETPRVPLAFWIAQEPWDLG